MVNSNVNNNNQTVNNNKLLNDQLMNGLEKASFNTPFGNKKPNSLYMFIIWITMKVLNKNAEEVKELSAALKLLNDLKEKIDDIIAMLNNSANKTHFDINRFGKDWSDMCKDKVKLENMLKGNSYLKKELGGSVKTIDDFMKSFADAFSGDNWGWWAPHHGGSVDIHDKNDKNFDYTPNSIEDLMNYISQWQTSHPNDPNGWENTAEGKKLSYNAGMVFHEYVSGSYSGDVGKKQFTDTIGTCTGIQTGVDQLISAKSLDAQGKLTDYNQIIQTGNNVLQIVQNGVGVIVKNMA